MGVSSGRERALVFESYEHAVARGAKILGEVVGYGSSAVGGASGDHFQQRAIANALRAALGAADPSSIGHIHAHGLGTVEGDQQEAAAIADVFGSPDQQPPVTTAKGHFGNLGAGGGMVEMVASVLSLGGELFPIRNLKILTINVRLTLAVDQVFRPEIHSSLRT